MFALSLTIKALLRFKTEVRMTINQCSGVTQLIMTPFVEQLLALPGSSEYHGIIDRPGPARTVLQTSVFLIHL